MNGQKMWNNVHANITVFERQDHSNKVRREILTTILEKVNLSMVLSTKVTLANVPK
jgi:hypothetical protein